MKSLRESLLSKMVLAVKDLTSEEARRSIEFGYDSYLDQLAEKGEFLLSQDNRHAWVRTRTADMSDHNNWYAYAMEVNFTYAFEKAGYYVKNSAKRTDDRLTDIDIVYTHENGVEVRMECVSIRRDWKKFWNGTYTSSDRYTFLSAMYGADGFANLLRIVQQKLRDKTINDGKPHKFPPPTEDAIHLIIADVTNGARFHLDYADIASLFWGQNYVDQRIAHRLLGLCAPDNPFAPDFNKEFEENRHIRERIHGILFVQNSTGYNNIFAPEYEGICMGNPELPMTTRQIEAVSNQALILKDLIVKWCIGLDLIKADGSVESLAGA